MTAFSLSGIEPMRFCRVVKEIDLQDFRRRRLCAISVCGSGLAETAAAIMLQMFSVGDKSGEFGGQSAGGM